ncbi:MAG TPA: globin domain-containing protein [Streptosporangiaceae bacterium]|nr:globin domain-containing protein [Streptosporangiaceae bacterium]
MDTARLRENFAHVMMHGDELPLFFYADLFIKHPELREMFPVSMTAQRGHFVEALGKIVSHVDKIDEFTAFLQGLGRDHRKFGAVVEHYDVVGGSLLATLEHFSGPAWTPDLATDWRAAYKLIGSVMIEAALADEKVRPPWWRGTVVAREQRAFDICVLFIRPESPLDYLPGQSVAIETPSRPKLWRYYSMANAPRPDGLLEFHIRLIDGGAVSMALTSSSITDTEVRLGAPIGVLTLDLPLSGRDLLLVAGSTGLAPLKAIVEQIAGLQQQPKVALFFGARTEEGLYDLDSLEKMAAQHPWLTVTPVVSSNPKFAGETGNLPDVVARYGDWSQHEAYIAGPTEMVREAVARLTSSGLAQEQIHIEDFGWSEP